MTLQFQHSWGYFPILLQIFFTGTTIYNLPSYWLFLHIFHTFFSCVGDESLPFYVDKLQDLMTQVYLTLMNASISH